MFLRESRESKTRLSAACTPLMTVDSGVKRCRAAVTQNVRDQRAVAAELCQTVSCNCSPTAHLSAGMSVAGFHALGEDQAIRVCLLGMGSGECKLKQCFLNSA